ncbi:MAG: hypothetical protein ABSB15_15520 [Bryobacteraceae bacterium]|jgi:hypothetical protein
MFIQNTARLLAGTSLLAICAFGQIVITPPILSVARTSNLPPVGIAGTETVQVILANTAANPANASATTGTLASCTGSVSFYDKAGTPIGLAAPFTLASGQIEPVSPSFASAVSSGRTLIRAVVSLTTTVPSSAPCALSYSLVIFDSATGATHAIVNDAGLSEIVLPLAGVL